MPIVASAVLVWLMGALIWTVLPWHKSDFSKTSDEAAVRSALKGLSPGWYNVPHCNSMDELKNEDMQQKFKDGPLAFITIVPSGLPQMGGKLVSMIVYNLIVAVLCAYMITILGTDGTYLHVFRIACTTAFIAYGVAYIQDSIWFGRPWANTLKSFLDAAIYGLLTGGVFGWLT
jgi:hypothetical protein